MKFDGSETGHDFARHINTTFTKLSTEMTIDQSWMQRSNIEKVFTSLKHSKVEKTFTKKN